jgi:hypothetical protein
MAGFARAKRWQALVGCTLVVGTSLLALAYLREWTFVAAAWAVAIAPWLSRPARRALARSACLALCVLIPVLPGLGLAGNSYVRHNSGILGYERTVLSERAKSAFVHPKVVKQPTTPSTTQPTTQVTVPLALSNEALVVPKGIKNDLRALPTGLVAFTLRPFPGQHGEGLSYDLAGVEELLYYPLYLLAIVGLVAYRRRLDVIAFPFVVVVLVTGIASEAEGNLGSAFRHRDQLLWAIVVFATLGAHDLYERWSTRRSARRPAQLAPDSAPLVHA